MCVALQNYVLLSWLCDRAIKATHKEDRLSLCAIFKSLNVSRIKADCMKVNFRFSELFAMFTSTIRLW
jgi:hypothetical protein